MTTAVAAQLVAVAACLLGLAGGWVCDVLARKERKPLSRIGVTVSAIASLSLAYLAINPIHAAPAIPPVNYHVMSHDLSLTPDELQIIDARHRKYMALRSE